MTPVSWAILIATALSCFFAACNYALLGFSRRRLQELLEARGLEHRLVTLDDRRDGLMLMTGLFRTICNLALLLAMIALFAPPNEPHRWTQLLSAFLISGLIIAVVGVAIPVSWSRYGAEALLARALPLLNVLYIGMTPIMAVLHLFDPVIRRLLGVPLPEEGDDAPAAEQEILDAVSEGEKSGLVDQSQKEMIEAVVEFPNLTVDQVMTPRTEVEGVPLGSSLPEVKRIVAEVGHSRIPVYEDDLDHIVGILYVKDLVPLLGEALTELDIRKYLREAIFVPETKTVRDLFKQFKQSNVHIAIVLDEYGGTAGLVTIEDILEEIVGDIRDEYEKKEDARPGITRLDDHNWEVAARVYVDDFNSELGVEIPDEEDYDTLGGFVFATLGHIPAAGETFDFGGLRFTVTNAEKTRVNTLRVEQLQRDEVPASEATD